MRFPPRALNPFCSFPVFLIQMNCAKCGNPATKLNKEEVPVCSRHAKASVKSPKCPDCKLEMVVRKGKFGAFWGCRAFPMCEGIRKI